MLKMHFHTPVYMKFINVIVGCIHISMLPTLGAGDMLSICQMKRGVEAYLLCFASSSVYLPLLIDMTSGWLDLVIYVTELTSPKLFSLPYNLCYDHITIKSQNCIVG